VCKSECSEDIPCVKIWVFDDNGDWDYIDSIQIGESDIIEYGTLNGDQNDSTGVRWYSIGSFQPHNFPEGSWEY